MYSNRHSAKDELWKMHFPMHAHQALAAAQHPHAVSDAPWAPQQILAVERQLYIKGLQGLLTGKERLYYNATKRLVMLPPRDRGLTSSR